jgi:hypothetical protein
MSFRSLLIVLAAASCAACAANPSSRSAAGANDELAPKAVAPAPERVDVDEYLEFLDELTVAVNANDRREYNRRELDSYRRIVGDLRASLQGVDNVSELNLEQQIKVFNLHEELQAVVIGDPRYRVICRRQQTVGTNFRQTTCMTVEEFRYFQDRGQEFLRGAWPYMAPPAN